MQKFIKYFSLNVLMLNSMLMGMVAKSEKRVVFSERKTITFEGTNDIIESIKKKEDHAIFTINHDNFTIDRDGFFVFTYSRKKLDCNSVLNTIHADEIPQEIAELIADYSEPNYVFYGNNDEDILKKSKKNNGMNMKEFSEIIFHLENLHLDSEQKNREVGLLKSKDPVKNLSFLKGSSFSSNASFCYLILKIKADFEEKSSQVSIHTEAMSTEDMQNFLTKLINNKKETEGKAYSDHQIDYHSKGMGKFIFLGVVVFLFLLYQLQANF